jgi:hypothetical protein
MKPIRWAVLALAVALIGCADERPSRPYSWNDLRMITAYTAEAACFCLFVEERTEEECRAYTKQSPAVATWTAETGAKTIDASAGLLWGARAKFSGPHVGCTVE